MWFRTDEQRLVNLANAGYIDVRQWPVTSKSWSIVAVFIVDGGRTLSLGDTIIELRHGGTNAKEAMESLLKDIENQLATGKPLYQPTLAV